MQEDLKLLIQLSEVDKKVHALQLTKKDLPSRIQQMKNAIESEKSRLQGIRSDLADTEAKIRENQTLIQTEQENLAQSNKRLENISTNREYDAVHLEIAAHKKNIDQAQANATHFQQSLENLQQDVGGVEAHYNEVMAINEPILKELLAELEGIEDRIAAQAAMGSGPREKMSKRILTLYDRVISRRGNPNILAAINHDTRHCTVCNRTQPPQRIIEISKQRALLTCEGCGSLLVWKEPEVEGDDEVGAAASGSTAKAS
jgi:predicted  nucleic acid-binding Zn-ribbon protein